MPVFISYQSDDRRIALSIRDRLREWSIPTYIDVMDPSLKTAEDITAVIVAALGECTHLMAVISQHTVSSWWVPFEIGVATKDDRRITSYRSDSVPLPDFLKIWPVLDYRYQLRGLCYEILSGQCALPDE